MLAVTTRNKLRSPRFFPSMVRAWLHVRQQLSRTSGMVCYITGIAGLTEFYTLTLWESRAAMFNFTAGDGHRQMMWNFTRWSESFWAMRWRPTADALGAWGNAPLADSGCVTEPDDKHASPAWLAHSPVRESLTPYIDTAGRPDQRDLDPSTCGVEAVLARVAIRSPLELHRLFRVVHPWRSAPGLLRFALGVGPGECLVVSLWRAEARETIEALRHSIAGCFREAWAMRLTAGDYEIGQWNHLRLRQMVAVRHTHPPSYSTPPMLQE